MSSRCLNKVEIIGNLGKNPELRENQNESMFCRLLVATNREWRPANSSEKREETNWHTVLIYGKLAEIASQILKKSDKVFILGRLHSYNIDNEEFQERKTEIVAENFILLS